MPRTIGFLVYPDFQLLDATGPIATFEIAARFSPGAYRLVFLSKDGGMVASSSGLTMATTALADAPPLDTLILAGGDGVDAGGPAGLVL
ncbi:MAG TPA: GlxA family transcriptional regulator, partial [Caulobacter sp.]|nr:GlxA family transcriptional regulator [Caulobacter sp.]